MCDKSFYKRGECPMPLKMLPHWFNHLSILFLLTTISCAAQPPASIGLKDGRLTPCPHKPNCVSSESKTESSRIEPLTFTGSPAAAWEKLKAAIVDIGGRIEKDENYYLWATFRSKIFRFVDDVECRMDAESNVIHLRSASRVGYSDFGVNRRRINKLRSKFNQKQ